ncbi:Ataxin 2 SM domain [Trypanosoma vivax]|uniref:LsmAD domain-containing protein n=1 Tax=Trypanosoma vivax (strain Y486) TaxID=1055687 RepID=G0U140_TRYVY|nr:hypothetical protein TRVL_07559 [Trypanosoma vivax]KAH8607955.1 Ataxin 2 SM domain [Trypanosoma vivax]CCC49795.1 conserved hypothetical protein [Trypanosoma vivax Y486]
MEGAYSSNSDRLEYLYLNLVGQVVQVRLVDDSIVEGIFVSCTDAEADSEAGIVLSCTRYLVSGRHKPLDPSCLELSCDSIIPYRAIVMVEVQNAKIRSDAPGRAETCRSEAPMAKFDWAEDGANELLESEPHQTGAWNQFEANEKSFGVKTSYNEEFYTTRLDHSKITEEQRQLADRVAREIESSSTRGIAHRVEREECLRGDENIDEGTLYSDVHRPQEEKVPYVPPSAATRKRGGEVPPPPATAPSPAGAMASDENSSRHKRPTEEKHAMQYDVNAASTGFNPAAVPYTPMKPGNAAPVADFLAALAEAIAGNDQCYDCAGAWPGMCSVYYDQDDSAYSQQGYEASIAPPVANVSPQMYMSHQPGAPAPHRAYQGAGGRMNHNQGAPMHHVHGQMFHPHQPIHSMGGYVPPQHQHSSMDYASSKPAPAAMVRNTMRPSKSGGASRVEPQQPVSANAAVTPPPPVPAVDSAPPEVKHTTRLQRGRGTTLMQRGDVDGEPTGAVTGGPKRRGGK